MFDKIKRVLELDSNYVSLYACKVCSVVCARQGYCPVCRCAQEWTKLGSDKFGIFEDTRLRPASEPGPEEGK